MIDTQVIYHQTYLGKTSSVAPKGWSFDKGSTKAWVWLVNLTRRGFEPFKTKRDKAVWGGQVYILSVVLSNAIGMAPPYWEACAFEIVAEERKR